MQQPEVTPREAKTLLSCHVTARQQRSRTMREAPGRGGEARAAAAVPRMKRQSARSSTACLPKQRNAKAQLGVRGGRCGGGRQGRAPQGRCPLVKRRR
eukprot:16442560-Heterocapsa_arctica.AAC.1